MLEDLGFFVIDNLPPMLIGKVAELARGHETPTRYALVVDVRSRRLPRTTSRPRSPSCTEHGAHHARPVPRRRRRRARAPLRGEPPPAPAVATPTASPTASRSERVLARAARRARPTSSSTRRRSTCTSCATGCASCSREQRRRRRAADQRRVVRLQARPAARRRPRVRLPLPPEPALGRGAAAAHRTRRAGARLRARAARTRVEFLDELDRLFALLAPGYEREGKSYLSIGVGCTGGRHRSVVIAEQLGAAVRAVSVIAPRCTTGTSTVTADD